MARELRDNPERFHAGTIRETHRRDRLLLDFDKRPPSFVVLAAGLARLGLDPVACYYAQSHTRGHWHVVVMLAEPLTDVGVIFAQLWLGSDRERERNNFLRIEHWGRRDPLAQVLFDRKVSLTGSGPHEANAQGKAPQRVRPNAGGSSGKVGEAR